MCPEEMVKLSRLVELPMIELTSADCNIGVNGVCPEEMVKLSRLVELPLVELTVDDCNIGSQWSVSRGNGCIKQVG